MSVTNLEIEAFKCQLYAESLGLFDEDSPATYAIILKHFGDDLSEEQLNLLNNQLMKAKAKMLYFTKKNIYESDLKPYNPNEVTNNYVIKHE
jgi:hypothetical protein